jgi:hypothetical protein
MWEILASKSKGGTTVSLTIYLNDVDAAFGRAIDADVHRFDVDGLDIATTPFSASSARTAISHKRVSRSSSTGLSAKNFVRTIPS